MLDTLDYDVTFPTGRRFQRSLSFEKGMTAIVGPNEHGKSLTIEFVRFALFGAEALRGMADDYKKLRVTLMFTVRDQKYIVDRGSKNCTFGYGSPQETHVTTARGTKPVNAAILAVLGFGLDVFDIACAANQGDFDGLSRLKPAARREMVDKLIGADRIEEVVSWTGEQALELKREIDALERICVEPTAPVKPAGYQPLAEVRARVEAKQAGRDSAVRIQAWLANQPPVVVEPDQPHGFTMKQLEQAEKALQKTVYSFDISQVKKQWEDYDLWQEKFNILRMNPHPSENVTVERAKLGVEYVRACEDRERLTNGQKTECPHCKKGFLLGHDLLEKVEEEIKDIVRRSAALSAGDIVTIIGWPEELRRAYRWEGLSHDPAWLRVCDAVETQKPSVPLASAVAAETNGITQGELDLLLSTMELDGATLPVVRILQRQLMAYEAELAGCAPAQARRNAWLEAEPAQRAQLAQDTALAHGLEDDRQLVQAVSLYDAKLADYVEAHAGYQRRVAEVAQKKAERASWLAGKDQLNALRLKLKSYLAPSLSQAASALLSQMTNGARTSVLVDETFEILVDGQKLQTLSGSGKVCANLALRIGLGQVLTNNVLSIFIGDEMDAFMDPERVEALNKSLERLLTRVKQVIVISHKHPSVSRVIDFGKSA